MTLANVVPEGHRLGYHAERRALLQDGPARARRRTVTLLQSITLLLLWSLVEADVVGPLSLVVEEPGTPEPFHAPAEGRRAGETEEADTLEGLAVLVQ